MAPELFESVMERLFAEGALDVFLTPIQMKKGRPATLLTALAPVEIRDRLADLIFAETPTFGIRHTVWERYTLDRRWETVSTPYGEIRIKIGSRNGEDRTASPEYEDVKQAANAAGAPVRTVFAAAVQAWTARAGA